MFLATMILLTAGIFTVQAMRFVWFALSPAVSPTKTSMTGEKAEPKFIIVNRRESASQLTKTLESNGLVSDGRKFMWLGRLTREFNSVKAGEYAISSDMSPFQILNVLTSGISVNHPVTVREGENMYEIADDIQAKGLAKKERFIALCKDRKFMATLGIKDPLPPSLEGFLFPDTYFFNRTMQAEDLARQMYRRFTVSWGPSEEKRAQELGMNRNQVITLASIIEKETGAPEERPLISSVFHNRIRKKMRLQSDPTTIYGMWDRYEGKIHVSDLQEQNEYNTYTIPGLPVGPISNPGKNSIQAALYPSQSTFLFFVSHNNGTHEFTNSLEDHQRAVRKFQLDPKAREGKSWRDLKKRSFSSSPDETKKH